MATWKRSSSEPVTGQTQTAVFDESGRDGSARVAWDPRFQICQIAGPVRDSNEEILDDAPVFK